MTPAQPKGLELLSENEVEMAAAAAPEHLVESVAPVDAHQSDHRQEDAYSGSGRPLEIERREVLDIGPGVACLKECKAINRGGGLQHEREVELHSETGVGIAIVTPWSKRAVVVSAERHGLGSIAV